MSVEKRSFFHMLHTKLPSASIVLLNVARAFANGEYSVYRRRSEDLPRSATALPTKIITRIYAIQSFVILIQIIALQFFLCTIAAKLSKLDYRLDCDHFLFHVNGWISSGEPPRIQKYDDIIE